VTGPVDAFRRRAFRLFAVAASAAAASAAALNYTRVHAWALKSSNFEDLDLPMRSLSPNVRRAGHVR
jgi:hypothetical protein